MDSRVPFVIAIYLLLQSMQFRNTAAWFLIGEMEYERTERLTRRREDNRRRRRRIVQSQLLELELVAELLCAVTVGCITERSVGRWSRPQGVIFWDESVHNFTDAQWRQNFRMSRETFEYLATELRPALEKQATNFRQPIDHRKRLAAVLWWFATPVEYRTVSTLFGIGISTLCCLVREVCTGIKNILFQRYISMPTGARLARTIELRRISGKGISPVRWCN